MQGRSKFAAAALFAACLLICARHGTFFTFECAVYAYLFDERSSYGELPLLVAKLALALSASVRSGMPQLRKLCRTSFCAFLPAACVHCPLEAECTDY